MSDDPSIDLRHDAGEYRLELEGLPPIHLSKEVFAHLARQFVKEAHKLREPLEPPYIVGLVAQYNVDGDQRTPLFTETWGFAAQADAQRFLDCAETDVSRFDIQWPFDLSLPAVPELSFWWPEDLTDPATALAEFRVVCFEHFQAETGPHFWDGLPLTDRERMWSIWATGEGLGGFDPAELEVWVAGTKDLMDL